MLDLAAAEDYAWSMVLLQPGSVLKSMARVANKDPMEAWGLGHNPVHGPASAGVYVEVCSQVATRTHTGLGSEPQPCWSLEAMVQLVPYRFGWSVFPRRARMLSRFKLLLKAMVQLQLGFVLMSVTVPQGAKGTMHVEIRGHAVLAQGKLALTLTEHFSKIAVPDPHGRAGPHTHTCTQKRCRQADPDGVGIGELAPPSRPRQGPELTSSAVTQAHSWVLGWHTLTSTPSRTHWSS